MTEEIKDLFKNVSPRERDVIRPLISSVIMTSFMLI